MNSIKPVGGPPTNFDYYAIAKATVTSVALMALSVGAMKGIQHYAKRTISPLQRTIAGVVLSAVYMTAAARFFGPLSKKTDLPPPSSIAADPHPGDEVNRSGGNLLEDQLEGEEKGFASDQEGISVNLNELGAHGLGVVEVPHDPPFMSPAFDVVPLLGPQQHFRHLVGLSSVDPALPRLVDLTRVDPRQILYALESFKDAIQVNDVRLVECSIPLQGRMVVVRADTSTQEKQLEALQGCDLLRALIMGGRRQALGFVEQAIIGPPHSEVRGQKELLRVEASRPAAHLEDEDLVLVENPGCADSEVPKDLAPPSIEEILNLKPKEQIQRIYNYYKDNLKKREQVLALRDLLLGCYKSQPKHYQLVLAVCKNLLEKKLVPFSGNPFHEFWSPLLFEVKELRQGFSYVRGERKPLVTLTDLFYFRQLVTLGQNQRLTDCFLEDLGQKQQQGEKVIRIKKLVQLLISSKYAKSSRFNKNFEHNMLY